MKRLLVEEGLQINREVYLGIVLDRAQGLPVMITFRDTGMGSGLIPPVVMPYSSPMSSIFTSFFLMMRLSASQEKGLRRTSRAFTTR